MEEKNILKRKDLNVPNAHEVLHLEVSRPDWHFVSQDFVVAPSRSRKMRKPGLRILLLVM